MKIALVGKGSFGSYYRINKFNGIKIIGRGFKQLKSLLNSKTYQDAYFEFFAYKTLEKSKITPKRVDFIIAKKNGRYYPAIKMQHIAGEILYSYQIRTKKQKHNSKYKTTKIREKFNNKIKKIGVIHKDIHEGNIIVQKNKFKLIDFTYQYYRFTKKSLNEKMYANYLVSKENPIVINFKH